MPAAAGALAVFDFRDMPRLRSRPAGVAHPPAGVPRKPLRRRNPLGRRDLGFKGASSEVVSRPMDTDDPSQALPALAALAEQGDATALASHAEAVVRWLGPDRECAQAALDVLDLLEPATVALHARPAARRDHGRRASRGLRRPTADPLQSRPGRRPHARPPGDPAPRRRWPAIVGVDRSSASLSPADGPGTA